MKPMNPMCKVSLSFLTIMLCVTICDAAQQYLPVDQALVVIKNAKTGKYLGMSNKVIGYAKWGVERHKKFKATLEDTLSDIGQIFKIYIDNNKPTVSFTASFSGIFDGGNKDEIGSLDGNHYFHAGNRNAGEDSYKRWSLVKTTDGGNTFWLINKKTKKYLTTTSDSLNGVKSADDFSTWVIEDFKLPNSNTIKGLEAFYTDNNIVRIKHIQSGQYVTLTKAPVNFEEVSGVAVALDVTTSLGAGAVAVESSGGPNAYTTNRTITPTRSTILGTTNYAPAGSILGPRGYYPQTSNDEVENFVGYELHIRAYDKGNVAQIFKKSPDGSFLATTGLSFDDTKNKGLFKFTAGAVLNKKIVPDSDKNAILAIGIKHIKNSKATIFTLVPVPGQTNTYSLLIQKGKTWNAAYANDSTNNLIYINKDQNDVGLEGQFKIESVAISDSQK